MLKPKSYKIEMLLVVGYYLMRNNNVLNNVEAPRQPKFRGPLQLLCSPGVANLLGLVCQIIVLRNKHNFLVPYGIDGIKNYSTSGRQIINDGLYALHNMGSGPLTNF